MMICKSRAEEVAGVLACSVRVTETPAAESKFCEFEKIDFFRSTLRTIQLQFTQPYRFLVFPSIITNTSTTTHPTKPTSLRCASHTTADTMRSYSSSKALGLLLVAASLLLLAGDVQASLIPDSGSLASNSRNKHHHGHHGHDRHAEKELRNEWSSIMGW